MNNKNADSAVRSGAALFFSSIRSADELFPFLSIPDGVLIGVMPPAGDFSHQRKVTKSWLRTNGSKNSYPDVYWLS